MSSKDTSVPVVAEIVVQPQMAKAVPDSSSSTKKVENSLKCSKCSTTILTGEYCWGCIEEE
jgi:hypothetical protein